MEEAHPVGLGFIHFLGGCTTFTLGTRIGGEEGFAPFLPLYAAVYLAHCAELFALVGISRQLRVTSGLKGQLVTCKSSITSRSGSVG